MARARLDEPHPKARVPGARPRGGEVEVLVSLSRPWTVVLSLVGDHDLTTVDTLLSRAAEQLERCDRLVLDLSKTTFVDSAVVNALVELARQARPRGVNLQVVALPGHQAHRVLDLMGLLAHLGWTDRLPEMHATSTASMSTSSPAVRNGTSRRNGASPDARGRPGPPV